MEVAEAVMVAVEVTVALGVGDAVAVAVVDPLVVRVAVVERETLEV